MIGKWNRCIRYQIPRLSSPNFRTQQSDAVLANLTLRAANSTAVSGIIRLLFVIERVCIQFDKYVRAMEAMYVMADLLTCFGSCADRSIV